MEQTPNETIETSTGAQQPELDVGTAQTQAVSLIQRDAELMARDAVRMRADQAEVEHKLWAYIKKIAKRLSAEVLNGVVYLWEAMKDRNVPTSAKVIAIAALLYIINPFDVLPDVIAPLGLVDDAAAATAAVKAITEILAKHKVSVMSQKKSYREYVDGE